MRMRKEADILRWLMFLAVFLYATVPLATADQYWVAWEGNDFPENEGWERVHGNWDGPGEGEATRSLVDGTMTVDSLFDNGVYDFSRSQMPGGFTVDPGETFVVRWALRVSTVVGSYDPALGLYSDDDWGLALRFGVDEIDLPFENARVQFDPGEFHEFEIRTSDFRTYVLLIDGQVARAGAFWEPAVTASYVAWGDGVQGAASLSTWDYFRFGVIPEPQTALITGATLPLLFQQRRRR